MSVDDLGKWGMRIRAARNEMGLTQQRLSDMKMHDLSCPPEMQEASTSKS